MSATVSTRWYFTDWMSDPNVRSCSYAARGLWMDMLCIAGTNRDRDHGFVLVASRVPTAAQLARLLGSTEQETATLIQELELNKVFNRDRRGAIYCRRMIRAEKSRANGKLAGEINHRSGRLGTFDKAMKNKENKKQPPPPIPEPEPELFKKVEVRPKIEDGWPDDFLDIFWREFPPYRRQAKAKVGEKLARIRTEGKVSWATLMNGVTKFAATQPGEFAPAPMVWLNDGRWDRVYGGVSNATNRNGEKLGFSALAARVGGGSFPEVDRPSPADLQPINRR